MPPPPLRYATRGRMSPIVLAARFFAPEFCRYETNKRRPSLIFVRQRRWWNRPLSRSGAGKPRHCEEQSDEAIQSPRQ